MPPASGVRERKKGGGAGSKPRSPTATTSSSSAPSTPTTPVAPKAEPSAPAAPEAEPAWVRPPWRQKLRYAVWALFAVSLSLYIAQRMGYFLPSQPQLQQVVFASRKDELERWSPNFPTEPITSADVEKRDAVKQAFKEAWSAYSLDAYGADEYHPISHTGSNLSTDGGIGYMIVDALDTIYLMGLEEEYARAREWVEREMIFERGGGQNVFEVTIRVLGGLLSTYALTHDPIYLSRSQELAQRLLPAFSTPSGIPLTLIDLKARQGIADPDNQGLSGTAEATTVQMEFKYLAEMTGEEEFWAVVEKVMARVRGAMRSAVVPIFISPETGEFHISQVRLGSRGDSFYEYLLKQYLQTDRTEPAYRQMYDAAMTEIDQFLIHRTVKSNLTFTAEMHPYRNSEGQLQWRLAAKQDHLACFLAGSLMLGVTEGQGPVPPDPSGWTTEDKRDWKNGEELVRTCMATHETATGLAPEIAMFFDANNPRSKDQDWYVKRAQDGSPILDGRYILRPETIESLFLAFRLTGDQKYRDYGWQIFQSIQKHCKLPSGAYAAVHDVEAPEGKVEREDKMETFMMSETLKYLWLLFSNQDVLPLDKWVFNTEAHPLPVFSPSFRTGIV